MTHTTTAGAHAHTEPRGAQRSNRSPFLSASRRYAGGSLPTLPRDLGNRLLDIVKLDDYQEPYQALKYAPYYSYSPVVMEMKDMMLNGKPPAVNHSGE